VAKTLKWLNLVEEEVVMVTVAIIPVHTAAHVKVLEVVPTVLITTILEIFFNHHF
jgi:hypothetical protein